MRFMFALLFVAVAIGCGVAAHYSPYNGFFFGFMAMGALNLAKLVVRSKP